MTTQVTATVIGEMLKPDQSLPLPDQSRVRWTIETIKEQTPEAALTAWETIKARLQQRPLHFGGQHYTRNEHYERR